MTSLLKMSLLMTPFITSLLCSRYKTSQELISHDTHNNTYQYKYTFSVEIVPVCKVSGLIPSLGM